MDATQILIRPVITEKASTMREKERQVVFMVHPKANKIEILRAVESVFSVKAVKVNVVNKRPGTYMRNRRKSHAPGWRKAYVTLAEGQKIDIFEGV